MIVNAGILCQHAQGVADVLGEIAKNLVFHCATRCDRSCDTRRSTRLSSRPNKSDALSCSRTCLARLLFRGAAAERPLVFLFQMLRKFFNDFRLPHWR